MRPQLRMPRARAPCSSMYCQAWVVPSAQHLILYSISVKGWNPFSASRRERLRSQFGRMDA